jgi:hypothetical protein
VSDLGVGVSASIRLKFFPGLYKSASRRLQHKFVANNLQLHFMGTYRVPLGCCRL